MKCPLCFLRSSNINQISETSSKKCHKFGTRGRPCLSRLPYPSLLKPTHCPPPSASQQTQNSHSHEPKHRRLGDTHPNGGGKIGQQLLIVAAHRPSLPRIARIEVGCQI